jgi:hypothetical protein
VRVASDSGGALVFVWTSVGQDGSGTGVYLRRGAISATGSLVGEALCNTFTTGNQSDAAVAVDADGDVMIVYDSAGEDGSGYGVYSLRMNASGVIFAKNTLVNSGTTGNQYYPAIALDADGDAIVVWHGDVAGSVDAEIVHRRFAGNVSPWVTSSAQPVVNVLEDAVVADLDVSGWFSDYETSAPALSVVSVTGTPGLLSAGLTNGKLSVGLSTNANGSATINLRATDSRGVTADHALTVTVASVNDLPVMAFIPDRFVIEGSLVTFTAVGFDSADSPPNALTYSLISAPAGATINSSSGEFSWSPDDGPANTAEFTVRVTDNGVPALFAEQKVKITVVNATPTISSLVGGATGQVNVTYTLSAIGSADVSQADTAAGFTYSFDWEGDGIFETIDSSQSTQTHVYSKAGSYLPTVRIKDKDGGSSILSKSVSILPPATVAGVVVNDGLPQRSRVTSLKVTFDQSLTLPSNPANAFQLKRNSDAATVNLGATFSGNEVTLTFIGGAVDGSSLADGRFSLTVLANDVNGGYFDGNGDGTPGDNFLLVGDTSNKLFRLFGDADGNGQVTSSDFLAFRIAFLSTNSAFDFDGNGSVDSGDFLQFRLRFLQAV